MHTYTYTCVCVCVCVCVILLTRRETVRADDMNFAIIVLPSCNIKKGIATDAYVCEREIVSERELSIFQSLMIRREQDHEFNEC